MQRILLLIVGASLLISGACSKGNADEATGTPDTGAEQTIPTAATTPGRSASPPPGTHLPELAWTKLPGPPSTVGNFSIPYFLDVESGDFYSIIRNADSFTYDEQTQIAQSVRVNGWDDSRGLVVTVDAARGPSGESLSGTYAAKPGQRFQLLRASDGPTWEGNAHIEVGGVAIQESEYPVPRQQVAHSRTVILDPKTYIDRQIIDERVPDSFSDTGRYLTVRAEVTGRLDVYEADSSGKFTLKWPAIDGDSAVWSHAGNVFAFYHQTLDGSPNLGIFDAVSGTTTDIGPPAIAPQWSPDDHYVAAQESLFEPGKSPNFVIYEAATGRPVLRVRGSWTTGWLDDDTFAFTGNVCGTFDVFSVNADGSDLRTLLNGPRAWPLYLSPDARTVVYASDYDQPLTLRLLDVASGSSRDVNIGSLTIFTARWHDHGRLLQLSGPIGKDGPCYTAADGPWPMHVERLP